MTDIGLIESLTSSNREHKITSTGSLHPRAGISEMQDILVLDQLIDDARGIYRLQIGQRVGYVTIPVGTFDDDTMCRPHLLLPSLLELPQSSWTKAHIVRSPDSGSLSVTTSDEAMRGVENDWHSDHFDVLSFQHVKQLHGDVHEVVHRSQPAILKIRVWEWEMSNMDNEIAAYELLQAHRQTVAPKVLGQVTENGRIIGLLLEKVTGVRACPEDLETCADALRQLHKVGLVHGDVNRHNFLVDREAGTTRLVDFEHVEEYDEAKAKAELDSLREELREETGRGSTVTYSMG